MKINCPACGQGSGIIVDEGKQRPDDWYERIGYIPISNSEKPMIVYACKTCGVLLIDKMLK